MAAFPGAGHANGTCIIKSKALEVQLFYSDVFLDFHTFWAQNLGLKPASGELPFQRGEK